MDIAKISCSETGADGYDQTEEYGLILLVGGYENCNLGDDVLLEVVLGAIENQLPNAEVVYTTHLSNNEGYVRKKHPAVSAVPAKDLFAFSGKVRAELLARTTCLLFGGGTQFYSFPKKGIRRILSYPTQAVGAGLILVRAARRRGIPVFGFALGIGPLQGLFTKLVARNLLKLFDHISFRTQSDLRLAESLGVTKPELAPDPSFALSLPPKIEVRQNKRVAFVVRDWPYAVPVNMISVLTESIGQLLSEGLTCDLVSVAGHRDMVAIREIESQLNIPGLEVHQWDPWQNTVNQAVEKLAEYQAVVTMRLHPMLLRARFGLPTISIDIDPKLRGAAEDLGLADFVISQANLNRNVLVEMVKSLFVERAPLNALIMHNSSRFEEQAATALDRLLVLMAKAVGRQD